MVQNQQVAVRVSNASKSYGSKIILNQLNMRVEKGIIYGLLGASGCGKTTLLSCIVGRKRLDIGNIWVLGGEPGTKESGVPGPNVGYMPQDVALVAEFTVQGAVFYFGRIFGMQESLILQKYQDLSKLLDLPPSDRLIKNCSGGQQRRISFAAAMVSNPQLLILDEPTVGLDPVLRESIWDYLVELTQKENTAVIITTHYIEETRQAHKIGLLRQGRLLAEESPDNLLSMFHTQSLEEVFLSLSQLQTEGRLQDYQNDNDIHHSDMSSMHSSVSNNDIAMTDFNGSKDILTSSDKHYKKKTSANNLNLNKHRVKALFGKNWMQLIRNPSGIAFMLMFPIFEMLAFFLAIGNDVKAIKIATVNEENCLNYSNNKAMSVLPYNDNECAFQQLSCRFLEFLDDPMIKPIQYHDLKTAKQDIVHGNVVGALYFPKLFSKALEEKLSKGRLIPRKYINDTQIEVWLDMSNRQIGTTIKYKLIDIIINFQKSVFKDCNLLAKLGNLPITFEESVYGHSSETFRVFMTPGVLLTIMFFMGATNTSSIIITDRLEGVWDRSIVAGVSSLEILITHFVTQFLLIVIQTGIILIVTFAIYQTEFIGNFATIIVIILLQGGCGMAFGFFVSVVSNSHSMANIVTSGSFYPMILTCGLIWPLEGMPVGLRWIAKLLPFTIPITSLRNVIKKGWSLVHLEVLNGVGVEIVWIILLGVISLIQLKRKR